jgi:hypothetical protein
MKDIFKTIIETNVKIIDTATGKVLVDKPNAIHPANMAVALARGLANSANHQIFKIKLGNQGTYIDTNQQIVFQPTNTVSPTIDLTADLYNPTYVEVVDDQSPGLGPGNSVTWTSIPASTSTRVIVTAVISPNEAINNPTDTGPDPGQIENGTGDPFFFDELGLFTAGTGSPNLLDENDELMLTHLIFSPIEHTGNRELTIIYTITITVS